MRNLNSLSSIINSLKEKVDSSFIESKIEQSFNDNNTKFSLYCIDKLLSVSLYGKINDKVLVVYGDHDIKLGSIIVNECNKKIYRVIQIEKMDLDITYNSNKYIRKGTRIKVDENIEEVKVIKVKNKYYLFKE